MRLLNQLIQKEITRAGEIKEVVTKMIKVVSKKEKRKMTIIKKSLINIKYSINNIQ